MKYTKLWVDGDTQALAVARLVDYCPHCDRAPCGCQALKDARDAVAAEHRIGELREALAWLYAHGWRLTLSGRGETIGDVGLMSLDTHQRVALIGGGS